MTLPGTWRRTPTLVRVHRPTTPRTECSRLPIVRARPAATRTMPTGDGRDVRSLEARSGGRSMVSKVNCWLSTAHHRLLRRRKKNMAIETDNCLLLRQVVSTWPRSEERRVGKECRARWERETYKKREEGR